MVSRMDGGTVVNQANVFSRKNGTGHGSLGGASASDSGESTAAS